MTAHFIGVLDETGTDGHSPYVVVGGAIARPEQWAKLEAAWERLLARYSIRAFHYRDFEQRKNEFKGWSRLRHKRFADALAKLVRRNAMFRIAIGIDKATHAEIKEKMKGVKGFSPDSDYGLCLRVLMQMACRYLETEVAPDFKISLIVERGPWTDGAVKLFNRVRRMTNPRNRAAGHAVHLGNITVKPKGVLRSLELADYLTGVSGCSGAASQKEMVPR